MSVKIIQDEDQFADAIKADKVTVVDFFASWCGACKKFMPEYEAMAAEFGGVQFLKCDVDEGDGNDIAGEAGVNGLPHLVVYKGGKKLKNIGNTSVTRSGLESALEAAGAAKEAGAAPAAAATTEAKAPAAPKGVLPTITGLTYFDVTDPKSGNVLAFTLDMEAKQITYTVGGDPRPAFKNAVSDGANRLFFPEINKGAQFPTQNLHMYLAALKSFIVAVGGEAKDFPAQVEL